jgi:hypothetical protein
MAASPPSVSAVGQRKRANRMRRAFKLALTWRWDRLFEAFEWSEDPTAAMAVHERHCLVMAAFVCTCRPVIVHAPARA